MADIVDTIFAGDAYNTTRSMLRILKRDFPEKYAGLLNQEGRLQEWKERIDSGDREDDQTRDDIAKYVIGESLLMSTYGISADDAQKVMLGGNEGGINFGDLKPSGTTPTPADDGTVETTHRTPREEELEKRGVGGEGQDPETALTILTSEEMKWFFDRQTGKWYVEYGLPNSNRNVIFEAEPDQMDALFGAGNRPTEYRNKTLTELTSRDTSTFAGNIAEMEGTGTFEGEVNRVTALALDNDQLPEWAAADGVAMDIIFIAQSEGKSTEWTVNQLSKTKSFKARFPGIEKFMGDNNMTMMEAVGGFMEYEAGVNRALAASGSNFDADPQMVGSLLAAGHSITVINDTVAGFARMKAYGPALDAFNLVLQAQGLDTITDIQGMFDFVTGSASVEVYDLYEASSIAEAAVGAGLGEIFTAEDALAAADAGSHDITSATQAMQKASELLLRLRHEVDVNKFGLDHEELIDISLGQTPRSGRAQSEIQESINRAVLSAQGTLQAKAKPHTSFSQLGTPQAASLRGLRQES